MRIQRRTTLPLLLIAAAGLVVGLAIPAAAHETNHLISGSSIKDHTITGTKLKSNTLTGAQIKESTLGTVPAARSARTATTATTAGSSDKVDGQQAKNFSFTVPLGGSSQTATVPGAVLTAECGLNEGDSILNIAGTQAGETYTAAATDTSGDKLEYYDTDLSPASLDTLVDDSAAGAGTANILTGTKVTTINYSWIEASSPDRCIIFGKAIG
jgi:hypothetical protein